jgi:hypothetical protein
LRAFKSLVLKCSLRISYTLKENRYWEGEKEEENQAGQEREQRDSRKLSSPEVRFFLSFLGML